MLRISLLMASLLAAALSAPAAAAPDDAPHWLLSPTGTDARLRGVAVVNQDVVWAAGSGGTIIRTVDGGGTWQVVSPPGTAGLRWRNIEAFDPDTALVLSVGGAELARVYRTTDGGGSWTEVFRNTDPAAFYDCMAFFDREHGLALSDPVGGRFRILSTSDGGDSWQVLPDDGMPDALPGEFGFANGGQCLTVSNHDAWIGTAGAATARVLHSHDRGLTWTVADTPLVSNPNAGIVGTAMRDPLRGVAVGGDVTNLGSGAAASAITEDGGRTWTQPETGTHGFRSGTAWLPWFGSAVVAVGPSGSDLSVDSGQHWAQFDAGSFDTVDCDAAGGCWAVGEHGRSARLTLG